MREIDERERVEWLFARLRSALPELEVLLHEAARQSSRDVKLLHATTEAIVARLAALAPDLCVNHRRNPGVAEGTGEVRSLHDAGALGVARVIIDAFLEAKAVLESCVGCARVEDQPAPAQLALVRRFYNLH